MSPQEQRRSNVRLAWALASIAVALLVAFVVKSALYGI